MSVWGHYDLERAIRLAKGGHSLKSIAKMMGYTSAEVDRALWAKVGRSIPDAIDIINAKAGRAA